MLYLWKRNKLGAFKLLFVFTILAFAKVGGAQGIEVLNDLKRIEKEKLNTPDHRHIRPYIFKNQPGSFKTLNPVSLAYGGLLFVYQNGISQHFSADCLYNPSCSEFSKQAVKNYGLIKGGLLSFDRLNRCNRITGADLRPSQFDTKSHRCNDPISKYK